MKILITGGLGGMTKGLLPKLSKFYEIKLSHWRRPESPPEYEFIKCDVRNKKEVDNAVKGVDIILHLAAKGANHPRSCSFQDALSVNVMGTLNLLEAAEKYKVKKFIYTSSVWVYGLFFLEGIVPEYFPIDESHPLRPKSPYGVTKLLSENLLEGYSRRAEFPIVVFRLGLVVKKDFSHSLFLSLEDRGKAFQYNGDFFQYIDVRDTAEAVRLAIEKDVQGYKVYNLVASDHCFSGRIDTLKLIKKYYPGVKIKKRQGFVNLKNKSLIDTGKIRKELGFKEKFLLQRYLDWINSGKKEEEYYNL